MYQEKFTAEEWFTLQFAPLWVFTFVGSADGKIDEKEFKAFASNVDGWAQFKEPLVQEVLLSLKQDFGNMLDKYRNDARKVDHALKEVADLLDKKVTPQQANMFKRAIIGIAADVAKASGGGFLGLGEKISTEEKNALTIAILLLRCDLD